MNLKIAFRADASIELGTGHVMRCLTLASTLRDQGAECQFISSLLEGNMLQAIQDKGFKASSITASDDWKQDAAQTQSLLLGEPVDWLVVDHYGLDSRWENNLKPNCKKLMVIDDLADRAHNCDLLLDQNLGRLASDYKPYVPKTCHLLIGPQYALLRPEFAQWREYSLKRRAENQELKHLLISMGGTDYPNSTSQILEALKQTPLPLDCRITVIMGATSPWIQQVTDLAKTMPWATEVKVNVNNVAELMANSDLAIGAAGSTTWERCCLGLHSLMVITASNQESGAKAMAAIDAATLIGDIEDIKPSLPRLIENLVFDTNLERLSSRCFNVCNGFGAIHIAFHLIKNLLSVRHANPADELMLFEWANDSLTRLNSINSSQIALTSHKNWLAERLSEPLKSQIFIISLNKIPIGQVRFDKTHSGLWALDYSLAQFYRGKKLAKAMLYVALDRLGAVCNDAIVTAQVKKTNVSSCAVIQSLGFQINNSTAEINTYEKYLRQME